MYLAFTKKVEKFGALRFELRNFSTQTRHLTARHYPAFTENIRFERMWLFKSNKFQAYHLKPLDQFSLILSRLELESHPYQERTLPIKLKNLTHKSTQIWTENMKFEASYFTIKLYSLLYKRKTSVNNNTCYIKLFCSKYHLNIWIWYLIRQRYTYPCPTPSTPVVVPCLSSPSFSSPLTSFGRERGKGWS